MKKIILYLLMIGSLNTITAQKKLSATLKSATRVSEEGEGGLFFAGERNVNYRFGKRITPHGDCVDVVNGYAFVTWYKGGMDKRNLMLSRKNLTVENSPWVTIQFPHQHVGQSGELFKGTGIRGDSHNTAAIGISTIDNTIHIIYDMHAYSKSALPTVFFNYSVSKKDMAFVPDNEFTLDIFNAKRTYLKNGQNYERLTYPMIHRADDGSLIARYRKGGSGNGDILLAHYDGTSWSNNWIYHEGTLALPNRNNMYGGERFLNGKFYAGFSIRYSTNNNTSTSNGYMLNSGLYYAYTNGIPKNQATQWFNVNDNPIALPIKNNINPNSDPVQIAQPGDDFGTATFPRSSSDPAWTVTENGAIHFVQRVDNRNVHYYKKATETNFSKNAGGLIPNPDTRGEIYSYKNHVFMVELINGKVNIKTTLEGENNWQVIYTDQENIRFNHFDAFVNDDKLYVYLMEDTGNNTVGVGDKRPLYFQEFSLSEIEDASASLIKVIEAEDFTTASNDIIVGTNSAASGGKYIDSFTSNQFLEYKFDITDAGNYDVVLHVAVRNRDDSVMDVEINDQLFNNFLVAKTGDWNIYGENRIENINLNQGENTIKLTQKRSLSSEPDKIEIFSKSALSTNSFSKNNIRIYPNPSNGVFTLNTSIKNIEYQLINVQGRILQQGIINKNQLDFSRYAKGIYLLRLKSSNNSTFIKRIILK
ncbi:BNR-4 repeat-containing protein [Polaribacter septentrionalilitoris]|uniref:BNR-4 repeat-containing protein n=1 Tax=Polaribacter septentrionalilitoris TaxID=2494657 RepID=UPI00135B3A6B|nr:BNR-4 repeat-containing protein [Polaribacter septentrionalilitoris]